MKWIVTAAAFSVIAGCQTPSSEPGSQSSSKQTESKEVLRVEVIYRERMMLPPTATVEVVLEDGAKMDVAADLISRTTVAAEPGPPYRVELEYDPSKLSPKGRFGVRARIESQGRLMFTSTEFFPAFGSDGAYGAPPNDPVKVLVRRTPGSTRAPATSITGTRWVVHTLRGKPAGLGAGGEPANITLQGAEPRVSGFAGCNRISGGYTLRGNQLSFGQMAMTMRACTEGQELERELAKVLHETKRYEVEGNALRLMDEEGTILAELEAD